MADEQVNPDQLARKWFVILIITALLYYAAAYFFVISPDVIHPGMEGSALADD